MFWCVSNTIRYINHYQRQILIPPPVTSATKSQWHRNRQRRRSSRAARGPLLLPRKGRRNTTVLRRTPRRRRYDYPIHPGAAVRCRPDRNGHRNPMPLKPSTKDIGYTHYGLRIATDIQNYRSASPPVTTSPDHLSSPVPSSSSSLAVSAASASSFSRLSHKASSSSPVPSRSTVYRCAV